MSRFEIISIVFMGIVLGYLWLDFRYKDALANATEAIIRKLGITPEEIEKARRR
jgi:hypothetical protein